MSDESWSYLLENLITKIFTTSVTCVVTIIVLLILLYRIFSYISNSRLFYVEPKVELKHLPDFNIVGKKQEPDGGYNLEDIHTIVQEMHASYETGHSRPFAKRIEQLNMLLLLMTENEKDIRDTIMQNDTHKTIVEATIAETSMVIAEIRFIRDNLIKWSQPETSRPLRAMFNPIRQVYEPRGCVLIINTWNFPFYIGLPILAGAIAAGNTIVFKFNHMSPAANKLMANLLFSYCDPAIVTTVGSQLNNTNDDIACTSALLEHPYGLMMFTGSTRVAKILMKKASEHLTPCIFELGGKNPCFVDSTADIDHAARSIAFTTFINAGQTCLIVDYVLCERSVIQELKERLKYYTKQFYPDKYKIGRLASDAQMSRVKKLLDTHDGTVVYGGIDMDEKERYLEPTIIEVELLSQILEEETFGPILWIVPIDDIRSAAEFLRSKPKPLVSFAFSHDSNNMDWLTHNTTSGHIAFNRAAEFGLLTDKIQFGGVGGSGFGKTHGKCTFNSFSHKKAVLDFREDKHFIGWLFPPYSALRLKILKLIRYT